MVRYISLNPADEEPILTILRNYTGIFEMETAINTNLVTKKCNISEAALIEILKKLEHKGVVALRTTGNDSSIIFNEIREDEHTINRVSKFLIQQNQIKVSQFESVIYYVSNNTHCKSSIILDYFDEKDTTDCGICSYCITKNRKPKNPVETALAVELLLKQNSYDSRTIENLLNLTPQETVTALKLLLEHNKIIINTNNQYTLK